MPLFPSPKRPPQGALLNAVMDNDIGEVKRLLRLNADINEVDAVGNTPLARAVSYGFNAIASVLIESGAKIDCQNKAGNTPLMMAIFSSYAPDRTALLRQLLGKGASLDIKNNRNETALDIAVIQSRPSVIDLLKETAATRKRLAEEFARAAEAKRREQIAESQKQLKELSKKRHHPPLGPTPPPAP
jgi:ankyrin repeat protein